MDYFMIFTQKIVLGFLQWGYNNQIIPFFRGFSILHQPFLKPPLDWPIRRVQADPVMAGLVQAEKVSLTGVQDTLTVNHQPICGVRVLMEFSFNIYIHNP